MEDLKFSKRYYARHIKEGVVHYLENGKDVLYLVTNEALRKMNKTFEGKPIYVGHVDSVTKENLKSGVGNVIKSFYNELDGAWWTEIIVDDEGQSYINKGWAVSNAYQPTELGSGGQYHDIDYQKEVKNGEYEHLAIVDNPRYEESVIMTPDEFQDYQDKLKAELDKLKNSKENEMTSEEVNAMVESLKNSLADTINEAVKNAVEEKLAEAKKNEAEEDHRELIREIAAVSAKAEGDFEGGLEEKVRTIIGLAEKLGYTKSENSKEEEKDNKCNETEDKKSEEKADKSDKSEEEEEKKENSKFFDMFKNLNKGGSDKSVGTMAADLARGAARYGK